MNEVREDIKEGEKKELIARNLWRKSGMGRIERILGTEVREAREVSKMAGGDSVVREWKWIYSESKEDSGFLPYMNEEASARKSDGTK